MKIAVVTSRTLTIKWFREDFLKTLAQNGCEVIVFGNEDEGEWFSYFDGLGVRYRSYTISRTGTNPIEDARTLWELKRGLTREAPDVVFSYQTKANIYGCIAAKLCGIEKVFASVEGLGSILLDESKGLAGLVKRVLLTEYKVALHGITKCFFVNNDDMSYFLKQGLIRHDRAVLTDGIGVNLDKFAFAPMGEGPARFLFVGRLLKDKGIFEYLEAARTVKEKMPEVEFCIIGAIDENPFSITSDELNAIVDEGTVSYCGFVDDVRPYLQWCTTFVLPSYHEGMPMSAMEAMAVGRPLIVSDCSGCKDLIDEGRNGFMVSVGDSEELANKMLVMARNQDLRTSMGEASRSIAEIRFDERTINESLLTEMEVVR